MKITLFILKILVAVLSGILVITTANMITSIIWLTVTMIWSVNVGMDIANLIHGG